MKYFVKLNDKYLDVELSGGAERALDGRDRPLVADMHLILGCLVLKRVWFRDEVSCDAVRVRNKLQVCFNVVRYTKACSIAAIDAGAESEPFPLAKDKSRFLPDSLFVDYRGGRFTGVYQYRAAADRLSASS